MTRYSEEIEEIEGFNILFDIEPNIRKSSGASFNLNVGRGDIDSFLYELEQMISAEKGESYVHLNALTLALLCRLCEKMSRVVMTSSDRDIVGLMEYIKSNIDGKITLGLLCDKSHMSPATLNRRFRMAVGMSPMEYVISSRTERAKELISLGRMTRTEIAQICGFYDLAHMNKYV